jgi:hypothetical protein
VSSVGDGFRFQVTVGSVTIQQAGGAPRTLTAGESLEVGIGDAVIDPKVAEPTPPPREADAGLEPRAAGAFTAEVTGGSASRKGPGEKSYTKLGKGSVELEANTVLRLGAATRVAVARGAEAATLVGAGEFVVGGADGTLVAVNSGKVSLGGAVASVRVSAPGGAIVAAPRAAGEVAVGREETRVTVRAEHMVVRTAEGDDEKVQAGQEVRLKREGRAEVEGRSLDYADIVFGPGESAIIHEPRPPTAVGFRLAGTCPEGGVVAMTSKGKRARVRGGELASLALTPGSYTYEVSCVREGVLSEDVEKNGRMTILSDAGTAPLPKSAPTTRIDADGRNYTVLYQTLLPSLTVAWPRPPKASSYSLTVTSAGKSRSLQTSGATYSFPSGQLGEGTHRLQFVSGEGPRSKTTTVTIAFDNAAPKATLRAPAEGGFAPGETVTVSGIALPGWSVRAGGNTFPVDAQHRFSGQAVAPTNQRALPILFTHPSRGTHHYLRRSAGAK